MSDEMIVVGTPEELKALDWETRAHEAEERLARAKEIVTCWHDYYAGINDENMMALYDQVLDLLNGKI